MSLGDLGVIYLVAGLACAVAIYRSSPERGPRAIASAAVAVPIWPLWAPIALTAGRRASPAPRPAADGSPLAESAQRIEAALREGVEACAGTPLSALLPQGAADRIAAEVRRAAARHTELGQLLGRDGFDLAAAERRVAELTDPAASPRALSTARLHLDNVRRLAALRERDARALAELSDLVQALRAQLVVARYAGAQPEGASGIVADLWARVEGLGVALGADEEPAQAEVA